MSAVVTGVPGPADSSPEAVGPGGTGRAERVVALLLLVVGTLVRCAYTLWHQVNPDEPQHLHVAWGWGRGLLLYRDIFDNHSPLFSTLCAPFLAMAGPRADIVIVMRWVMVPMMLLTLWALWSLVRSLFGPRAALWAVVIAGVQPDLVLRGVEYRSDVLWTACWTLFLAAFLGGRFTARRALGSGLLLGAAFSVSMKTSLLASAVLFSLAATAALLAVRRVRPLAAQRIASLAATFVAGMVTLPAILIGYFGWLGVLPELRYGVLTHNVVPGLGIWQAHPWLPLLFFPALPVLVWGADRVLAAAPNPGSGARRAILFLTATSYWLAVQTTWPLVTRQDWLPLVPMGTALFVPLLFASAERTTRRWSWSPGLRSRAVWGAAVLVTGLEMVALWHGEALVEDRSLPQQAILGEVLRLTAPGDSVLDPRGEAIFRDRPYYYICEAVTLARMEKGLLPDRIPERLISSHVPVVYSDAEDYPPRARSFMRHNFVSVGRWRVVGLTLPDTADGRARSFSITIPQRYALVSVAGPVQGWLDGRRYSGPVDLAAGLHSYLPASGERSVVALWAPAVERGFSPFPFLEERKPESVRTSGGSLTPDERVMVIAPHPDDETLAAGELLAGAASRDIPTSVVFVTDGENNPWAQLACEGRWPFGSSDRRHWGERRHAEARVALAGLGVPEPAVRSLCLPDQHVTECLFDGGRGSVESLVSALHSFRPTLLVVPSASDVHPDHSATALLVDLALARLDRGESPRRILEYVIHPRPGQRSVPGKAWNAPPPADSPLLTAKRKAIGCYKSQLPLRAQFLRRFAQAPERLDVGVRAPVAPLSAQAPSLDGDVEKKWSIRVAGSLRLLFGNPRLMLVGYRGEQTSMALISPLRTGRVAIVDAITHAPLGEAIVRRSAMDLEIELDTPGLRRWSAGFFKLDLARERQFGLFDAWGWQPIPLASRAPQSVPPSLAAASVGRGSHRTGTGGQRTGANPWAVNVERASR